MKSLQSGAVLWGVVCLNAMLWIFLPWAVGTSPALDAVEGIIWGQEWQWGYYKHPPLPSSFLYLIWLVSPDLAPMLASQICIAATVYFVYQLGQCTIGRERAVFGSLLLYGLYHFTFPTPQFNHNVAQMPLWAAAYYFAWRAFQEGRLRHWGLTGLAIGLAVLTKYSSLLIVAALALYWLVTFRGNESRRPSWVGPLLAASIALVVIAPHLAWLVAHDFLPIRYLLEQASREPSGRPHLFEPLRFLASQVAAHLPMLLVLGFAGLLSLRHWRFEVKEDIPQQSLVYLAVMATAPVGLVLLGSLMTGAAVRDEWGVPMWNLSGLLLAMLCRVGAPVPWRQAARGASLAVLFFSMLFLAYNLHAIYVAEQIKRNQWPAKEIGRILNGLWHEQTGGCKLKVVSGPYWIAGVVSIYGPDRPSVLIDNDLKLAPWLSGADLMATGMLRVSEASMQIPGENALEVPSRVQHALPVRLYWSVSPPNQPCTNVSRSP